MMHPISLDYISNRKPSLVGMVVLVVSVILLIGLTKFNFELQQQIRRLDQSIQELKITHGLNKESHKPQPKSSAEQLEKIEEAKKLAAFLMIPWGDLFNALEGASLEDVAILSIEPDSKKRELKINAEAKNVKVMFSYLERLEASHDLVNVYLLKHEILEDVDQHPIRFMVMANWKEKP
jgi:NADH:ubiquinone oxidoreductase subunit D